jgi:hydrogenase maturation protein HypF
MPPVKMFATRSRFRLLISGAVQGVGFRPHAYRLAREMKLAGWVANDPGGVLIEVEGEPDRVERFVERLVRERPKPCEIETLERERLTPLGGDQFEIHVSDEGVKRTQPAAPLPPDLATCDACRRELFDPADRRYRYPFLNCTDCGPRYTIVESLPYDRMRTVMRRFAMCPACRREYDDPRDRRFHAQPNACPDCGPHLALWDDAGRPLAQGDNALLEAAEALREGRIIAVKGLGGFHLMVDGCNDAAVRRLRERKRRPEKPFALLFPSLEAVETVCEVSPLEARLLCSPEAPIVLLRRKESDSRFEIRDSSIAIAPSVAPRNPYLGVMLPATPLQHLLMAELGVPCVATSGNRSDEPICIDEEEALARLHEIADLFLIHDRPIARAVDDSVVRTVLGRELVLRRARGYSPRPVSLGHAAPTAPIIAPIIAMGGHLKNTVAISVGAWAVISQHLGDLGSADGCALHRRTVSELPSIYQLRPAGAVADLHPDYRSTLEAEASGLPVLPVQHHHAHVAACMAEHQLRGAVLGVAWDGTGWGPDGTIWGGEFLLADEKDFNRVATFRRFRLPGGERAIKAPWRTAIGLLWELWGEALFERDAPVPLRVCPPPDRIVLQSMLERGVQAPVTSSIGRLFDAVASITGLRQRVSFDGQAAMELEWAAEGEQSNEVYPFRIGSAGAIRESPRQIVDWEPMITAILDDVQRGVAIGVISAKFHNTLAETIVAVAQRAGLERVVLGGGCFQNRLLLEGTVRRLRTAGLRPFWPHRVPPNDGGLALGQLYVAMGRREAAQSDEWKVDGGTQGAGR